MNTAIVSLLLIAACLVSGQVPSIQFDGMEVITNNVTSFIDQFYWHQNTLYVLASGKIFKVTTEGGPFEMSLNTILDQKDYKFLAFALYNDTLGTNWVMASTIDKDRFFPGFNFGFVLATEEDPTAPHSEFNFQFITKEGLGYMMTGCAYGNTSDPNTHSGYFAGFEIAPATSSDPNEFYTVDFTLIRLVFDPVKRQPLLNYNTTNNRVLLHQEGFTSYNNDFRPLVFHNPHLSIAIVVDPATATVFRIHTPVDPNQPLTYDPLTDRYQPSDRNFWGVKFSHFTSATYDYYNNHLYLGLAAWGIYPGRIAIIDLNNNKMNQLGFIELNKGEANPISITFDNHGPGITPSFLYIAFYGMHHITKYSISTHSPVGYMSFPPTFGSIYGISNHNNNIYFITNEQYGKVGRISVDNVCPSTCDIYNYGYCLKGKCACRSGTKLGAKDICEVDTKVEVTKEKGGEVALAILFAISFVIGCVAWYFVYRERSTRL